MSVHRLWVPGMMPAGSGICGMPTKLRRAALAEWAEKVRIHVRQAHFPRLVGPHEFFFEHRERTDERSPVEFTAGGAHVMFSALYEAGIMENDGWKQVVSIQHMWKVDAERPGVLLTARASGV